MVFDLIMIIYKNSMKYFTKRTLAVESGYGSRYDRYIPNTRYVQKDKTMALVTEQSTLVDIMAALRVQIRSLSHPTHAHEEDNHEAKSSDV